MSRARISSFRRLDMSATPKGDTVGYMDALQDLHKDIRSLEQNLHEISLGYTGYNCHQRLDEIEQKYANYISELEDARDGIIESRPTDFSRWEGNWNPETQNEFDEYWADLLDEVERTEKTAGRIANVMLSKRNAANTRMVVSLSLIAVIVSTCTVLAQIGLS